MSLAKFEIEHTDTFGGEANYSWCTRKVLKLPENVSDISLIRLAKRELGISKIRHRKEAYGDSIRLDLVGCCEVVFINFLEEVPE